MKQKKSISKEAKMGLSRTCGGRKEQLLGKFITEFLQRSKEKNNKVNRNPAGVWLGGD